MKLIKTTRPCILIETSAEETYVLPYGHLLSCALLPNPETNEPYLEMIFACHTALVEGERLGLILKKISGFEIGSLQPSTSSQSDQPSIRKIQILSRQEDSEF